MYSLLALLLSIFFVHCHICCYKLLLCRTMYVVLICLLFSRYESVPHWRIRRARHQHFQHSGPPHYAAWKTFLIYFNTILFAGQHQIENHFVIFFIGPFFLIFFTRFSTEESLIRGSVRKAGAKSKCAFPVWHMCLCCAKTRKLLTHSSHFHSHSRTPARLLNHFCH